MTPEYPDWRWHLGQAYTRLDEFEIMVEARTIGFETWVYAVNKIVDGAVVPLMSIEFGVEEELVANIRKQWEELSTMLPELIMESYL